MRVVTLVENDSERSDLKSAHGLSLYIEHGTKKILFDIGPGNQYIKNAKKLGIDLKEVDICVISHGHFDHGRGLSKFLRYNKKARVYISKHAFSTKPYKIMRRIYIPIGISSPLFKRRIEFIDGDFKIENGIKLYTNVPLVDQAITDNTLLMKTSDGYYPDKFEHEIYMSLYHSRQRVLFSGCSHKGVEHIKDHIEKVEKKKFTAVVGGFHFSHYDSSDLRQSMYLQELGEKFAKDQKSKFFTGHCTGDEAYIELKGILKENIKRIKTGTEFKI